MGTVTQTQISEQGRQRFERAAHLDICEVADRLGIELQPDGRRGCRGRCPACDGRLVLTPGPGRNKGFCNGACDRSMSTIDLAALALGCQPWQAVRWLLDDTTIAPAAHRTPVERPEAPEPALWLDKTHKRNGALLQSAYSHEKRLWLANRGLVDNTWKRWLLGDAGHGVALPWLDKAGAVVAVNIRRLNEEDKRKRYYWDRGVYPFDQAYGAHLWSDDRAGVLVVEGEFNALALWQYAGDRYNVVSPGSSSAKLSPAWALRLSATPKVAVWADDQRTADKLAGAIAGPVVKIVSPVKNGVKYDANECLKRGFLASAFERYGL